MRPNAVYPPASLHAVLRKAQDIITAQDGEAAFCTRTQVAGDLFCFRRVQVRAHHRLAAVSGQRTRFVLALESECAPSTAAKAKLQRLGFQIEVNENKTPGGEQYLDPLGAELLAWF
jgi:hypothetical protein